MKEQDCIEIAKENVNCKFENVGVVEEKIFGAFGAWQVVFDFGQQTLYLSAERGSLDFHVLNKDGQNLGLRHRNESLFSSYLKVSKENIELIIDFLFQNRDEIFTKSS